MRMIPIRRPSAADAKPATRTRFAWAAVGFLLALLYLASCANKDKVPSGIIPPDKMQKILWDMIQADQYSDMYLAKDSGDKAKQETLTLYAQVFQLHKVSREDFRKSFQYYIDRPDLNRSLLDSVLKMGNHARSASPVTPATPLPKGTTPPQPVHPFVKPGGQIPSVTPRYLPPGIHGAIPPKTPGHPPVDSSAHHHRVPNTHRPDSSAHHPRISHPT